MYIRVNTEKASKAFKEALEELENGRNLIYSAYSKLCFDIWELDAAEENPSPQNSGGDGITQNAPG